nr:MAG TPA: hypothetical protein [Caudoviricetes sp.]
MSYLTTPFIVYSPLFVAFKSPFSSLYSPKTRI